uniref:Reverse transcriptase domain-containing protein n=1 Tax=Octopus bimaculoides TaxID=37653 RepID=A0A0L8FL75_OCTBM
MQKLGIDEWLMRAVQAMYRDAVSKVRVGNEYSEGFQELLYADDLALIAESLSELEEKFQVWKQGLESKSLRVNLAKTKVLISRKADKSQIPSVRWPCSVCRKSIGRNSIRCIWCKLWTHKRSSNIKGKLTGKIVFVCAKCSGTINTENVQKTASITCYCRKWVTEEVIEEDTEVDIEINIEMSIEALEPELSSLEL